MHMTKNSVPKGFKMKYDLNASGFTKNIMLAFKKKPVI